MDRVRTRAFAALIAAQAAHSVEEYVTRLFDVFAPARFISGLFSDNVAQGFVIANVLLVLAGVVCWAAVVRPSRSPAAGVAWLWGLLELGNGVSHTAMAIATRGYFPGIATAPFLLAGSIYPDSLSAHA